MPFAASDAPTPPAGGTTSPDTTGTPSTTRARRRRRPLVVAALAAVLVATGGTLAVAAAHKTVTLDVDGATTRVSTFAGSVDGLLAEQSLELDARDLVSPAADTPLASGDEIVVRRARQVVLETEGEREHVWTTALSAQEALRSFEARGTDVRLVASRSGERADLSLVLDVDGPVDVVVDGTTHEVADGSAGLPEVLDALGITLGDLDRVHVDRADETGRVTVTIQRVVADERTTVTEVPFETVTHRTDELYRGQSEVAQEGVPGEHTAVHRVIVVDGQDESSLLVREGVTRAPVEKVVRQGTKARPAPAPVASTGAGAAAGGGGVGGDVWAALAQCESGGNPSIVSRNGLYHGLYQFSVSTWQSVGGTGLPSQASAAEQTERAQILQARSGWGQWPACSRKLGLR